MDDFEFKPITDGLGFHHTKKTQKPTPAVTPSSSLRSKGDLVSTLRGQDVQTPEVFGKDAFRLPRADFAEKTKSMPFPLSNNFKETRTAPHPEVTKAPSVTAAVDAARRASEIFSPQVLPKAQVSSVHLGAMILDLLVMAVISVFFVVAVLLVAEAEIQAVLANIPADFMTTVSVATLFAAISFLYLLISRSFFGASLGEWAFDQKLGTSDDQASGWFPIEVLVRTFVVALTGVILLPLLSWITGTDWAGRISGLQLYKE